MLSFLNTSEGLPPLQRESGVEEGKAVTVSVSEFHREAATFSPFYLELWK